MWIHPKTTWVYYDYFNVDPDWNRITGNMLYLKALARPFFGDFVLDDMPGLSVASLPYEEVLNSVEDNLGLLLKGTFDLIEFSPKETQYENQPIWDFRDLNRIESMQLRLHELLPRCKPTQPTLAFKLGGGYFASGLS